MINHKGIKLMLKVNMLFNLLLDKNIKSFDFKKPFTNTQWTQLKSLIKLNKVHSGFNPDNISIFLMDTFSKFELIYLNNAEDSEQNRMLTDFGQFIIYWQTNRKFKIRDTYVWRCVLDILHLELSEWLLAVAISSIVSISILFCCILLKYLV
jgi:hypothetical protein